MCVCIHTHIFGGEAGIQKLNFLCVFETLVKVLGYIYFMDFIKRMKHLKYVKLELNQS